MATLTRASGQFLDRHARVCWHGVWFPRVRLLLTVILLAVVAGAVAIWTGVYDVAASTPHSEAVAQLFGTVRDRSIAVRARKVGPPPRTTPDSIRDGYEEYSEMCVVCHGAPGEERSAISKGLNPPAPDLDDADLQAEYSDAELFWTVKHGIRMTGMPAFGDTHDDDTIWAIIAFVRRLPQLGAKGYAAMESDESAAHEHHGEHEHSH